jgi:hypothetical protein
MKETVILFSCLALCSSTSWAGVYKCAMPDGRLAYQQRPCSVEAVTSEDTKIPTRSAKSLNEDRWQRDLMNRRAAVQDCDRVKKWLAWWWGATS